MSRSYKQSKDERCNKRRYPTERDAQVALGAIKRTHHKGGNQARMEQRYYACGRCRGFHLTSH